MDGDGHRLEKSTGNTTGNVSLVDVDDHRPGVRGRRDGIAKVKPREFVCQFEQRIWWGSGAAPMRWRIICCRFIPSYLQHQSRAQAQQAYYVRLLLSLAVIRSDE